MGLPQYEELTSEDDGGAPPLASSSVDGEGSSEDEEESPLTSNDAAYLREVFAHYASNDYVVSGDHGPHFSYHGAHDAHNRAVASARAYQRAIEAISILPEGQVIVFRDFVPTHEAILVAMQEMRLEVRFNMGYGECINQAAAAIGSRDIEEVN